MSASAEAPLRGTGLKRSFVKDLAVYLPSKLLPALTGFISAPILTRLFLPAEYGNYVLALGIADLLYALACSGLGSVPVRFLPAYKSKADQSVFFSTLSASLASVTVLTSWLAIVVLVLLRSLLPADLYPLLFISVLVFVVQSAFLVLLGTVRAQGRSEVYTAFELTVRYGTLGLGLLFVIVFKMGISGLLWGAVLAHILCVPALFLMTTRQAPITRRNVQMPDATNMWRYAWPLAVGNMAMWGLRLADRYVITFFRSETEVGLYSASFNISNKSIDMLVALFLLSIGPLAMTTWEKYGRRATEASITMITRLYLIVCLPAAAGMAVLGYPLVALLTGEAYHEGYRIAGFVAFASFAWGLSQIASLGTLIQKNTRRVAANQGIAAAATIGLNLLLVPWFGFVAAGAVSLVGNALLLVLQAKASQRHLAWRVPIRTVWNTGVSTVAMSVVAYGIYRAAGPIGSGLYLKHLIVAIGAAIPVYLGVLWLLGEANSSERAAVRSLLVRVARKAHASSS
ncbi:MAG: oligosaccharide flippase family protein [Anaerolineae bacterium]